MKKRLRSSVEPVIGCLGVCGSDSVHYSLE